MNSFLYKADSKELWLKAVKPAQWSTTFPASTGDKDQAQRDWDAYQNRLHYTVSPELAAILTEGQEVKEGIDFIIVGDDDGGRNINAKKIAIPLPEQTKPKAVDPREYAKIWAEKEVYTPKELRKHTNQEAGKQSAEQVAKTLDEIRDNLVDKMPVGKVDAWQLIKVIGNHVKELDEYIEHQSTQPAAATHGDDDWPIQCELDEQQCKEECEHKNVKNREGCPFVSRLPYRKEFEEYFKKYYPHLITNEAAPKGDDVKSIEEILKKNLFEKVIESGQNEKYAKDMWLIWWKLQSNAIKSAFKLSADEYASQFAAPQAVKWVQASERLPEKRMNYFVKVKYKDYNGHWNTTSVFDNGIFEAHEHDSYGKKNKLDVAEWLDEGSTDKNETK